MKTRAPGAVAPARGRLTMTALTLAIVAGGSVGAAGAPESAPRARDRIKVVAPPYFTSAPLFVAADLGYFAAEDLDVEFVNIAHSNGSLPALAQGQVDAIGTHANAALFNLIGRGAKVRIVAARSYEAVDGCATNAVVVRKGLSEEGRLANGDSMRGLRLSVEPTGTNAMYFGLLLDRMGLSFEDFELSDVVAAARGEALKRGLIDLTVVYEPDVTLVMDTGAAEVWIPGRYIAPDHQYTYVVFGERLLERERGVGERFVRGYLRGVERYLDDEKSSELVEALAQRTHLDADLLRRMCWPPTVRDGHVDRGSLERYQAWAKEQGLIDATIDVGKMIDSGFLGPVPLSSEQ